jgi:RNA-directed DNA polymerase
MPDEKIHASDQDVIGLLGIQILQDLIDVHSTFRNRAEANQKNIQLASFKADFYESKSQLSPGQ